MKHRIIAQLVIGGLLSTGMTGLAADGKPAEKVVVKEVAVSGKPAVKPEVISINLRAPLFSPDFGQFPLAKINDEKITIQDFNEALSALHEGMKDGKQAAKTDFSLILDRLINSHLIIQEAKNMGLEDLPEVKEVNDDFARKLLREKLLAQHVKDLKPNEKDVEKAYRERTVEWKIKSLIFKAEDDAKKAEKEIKAGKSFDPLYAKALKDGKAEKGKDDSFIKTESMPPEIIKILSKMKNGSFSPIIPLQTGYLIFRLDDVRHVENAKIKDQVRQDVLTSLRLKALEKYRDELIKKHIKQKKGAIDKLDFEAKKPGFKAMQKDKRVIAEVKGDKPVTVSDLAEAIKTKFFHGVEMAASEKKVNKSKQELLSELLASRAIMREAVLKKIDQTDDYRKKVREFKGSVLFGMFVQKVIKPDIKLSDEELQGYYREHISKYTYPEMLRVDAIVFSSNKDAEAAVDKLRKGMDYKWFKENAEGRQQAQPKLVFDGNLIMKSQLPEDVQKTLTGVKSGEYRQLARDKEYYVLNVQEVVPSKAQPFSEVESDIKKIVYSDKLNKSVESWAAKLRKAYDLKIYAEFKK